MLIVFYTKSSAIGRVVSKRNDLRLPIRRLLQTSKRSFNGVVKETVIDDE